MAKPRIICIMGPTATGKTDLAIKLCQHLPCDIVSVDSAMVYKGMDIGSAKPSAKELAKAPHRLIDIREPWQPYSAADFREDAISEINDILSKDRVPLLVGGTMLYYKVLQQGIADLPQANQALREKLQARAESEGWDVLHKELQQLDPKSAARIHPNDPQRLLRALEVYQLTGEPMSALWQQQTDELVYDFINIALTMERDLLRERIAMRFKKMMTDGFVEEVKKLKALPNMHVNLPSMKSVGYQQAWQYLDGEITKEDMSEKIVTLTRRFAKRQMTWLRSWPDVQCFDALDDDLFSRACEHL